MNTGTTVMTGAAGAPGFVRNLLNWMLDLDDAAVLEAGRRRLRSAPGFLASLPPVALGAIRGYDGPENLGPPRAAVSR
ncbi:MAG TPA: hypothetical protein VM759_04025 [Longimicrobium sp.]|nr:hypothetical protein [Longimicrobium sp.]